MNIFMKPNIFSEELPVREISESYCAFFALAQELRIKLGTKAYLLDNYISCLLDVAESTLSVSVYDDGMESISGLYAVIRNAMNSDKNDITHPFLKTGREFISAHPLELQERETKTAVYVALLVSDYVDVCVKDYRERLRIVIAEEFDALTLDSLYKDLCGLLQGEGELERLNKLFYRRFLTAGAEAAYLSKR